MKPLTPLEQDCKAVYDLQKKLDNLKQCYRLQVALMRRTYGKNKFENAYLDYEVEVWGRLER